MSARPPILVDLKFDPDTVARILKTAFADRGSINSADPANKALDLTGVDYALLWKPDADIFQRAPNLKVLFSGGAGVDSILSIPDLPDIPIVRFVDRSLTTRMSEWVVMQCLMHLRLQREHDKDQRDRVWGKLVPPEAAEITVGVMGLGILGQDAVAKLRVMGFNVIGWSRSKKEVEGIETFDGSELDGFLSKTDIVVGLLPLTPDTTGLLQQGLLRQAPPGRCARQTGFHQCRPRQEPGPGRYRCGDRGRRARRRLARCLRGRTAAGGRSALASGDCLHHPA